MAALSLCVAAAYVLKLHYSRASPEALLWILGPTTRFVEILTPHEFVFEAGVGFSSRTALVAITKACAGVNFLIISAVVLAITWVPAAGGTSAAFQRLLFAWLVAFGATILVNGFRILLAIHLHRPHRLEGTVVYFGALLILHALARSRSQKVAASPVPGGLFLIPGLIYGGVTLVVPALNGALDGAGARTFVHHAETVMMVTLGLSVTCWLLSLVGRGRTGQRGTGTVRRLAEPELFAHFGRRFAEPLRSRVR